MALTTNFADFEDAIQYSTAVLNHLDAIITRNPGDFPVTTPRILTPEQLIQEVTNSQYEYGLRKPLITGCET